MSECGLFPYPLRDYIPSIYEDTKFKTALQKFWDKEIEEIYESILNLSKFCDAEKCDKRFLDSLSNKFGSSKSNDLRIYRILIDTTIDLYNNRGLFNFVKKRLDVISGGDASLYFVEFTQFWTAIGTKENGYDWDDGLDFGDSGFLYFDRLNIFIDLGLSPSIEDSLLKKINTEFKEIIGVPAYNTVYLGYKDSGIFKTYKEEFAKI